MTRISHLSIYDKDVDHKVVSAAVSFIKTTIAGIDDNRARLDGDSVVAVEANDGEPRIMLQRNWQVTDVIRLNIWREGVRPVINLAIRGAAGHRLHKDPYPQELVNHAREILETALPYLENIKPSSDPIMQHVDDRIAGISAIYPGANLIAAPSVCNTISYENKVSAGTSEIHSVSDDRNRLMWQNLPRIAVLSHQGSSTGSTMITLYPYKAIVGRLDPIERLRLIATMPPGSYEASKDDLK